MARLGRYFLPDQPLHVIQRGNYRGAIFFVDDDYAGYRDWLAAAAAASGCAIHACVLMTKHVHLLVTARDADGLPRTCSRSAAATCATSMRGIDEPGLCG